MPSADDPLSLARAIDPERAETLLKDFGSRRLALLLSTAYPALTPVHDWQLAALGRIVGAAAETRPGGAPQGPALRALAARAPGLFALRAIEARQLAAAAEGGPDVAGAVDVDTARPHAGRRRWRGGSC